MIAPNDHNAHFIIILVPIVMSIKGLLCTSFHSQYNNFDSIYSSTEHTFMSL